MPSYPKTSGVPAKAAKPSMKATFAKVLSSRPPVCEICGARIAEPKAECFAHLIGRNLARSRKYDPNNVKFVCANGRCHNRVDTELRPAAMAAMNNEPKPAIGYPKPR